MMLKMGLLMFFRKLWDQIWIWIIRSSKYKIYLRVIGISRPVLSEMRLIHHK